MRRSTILLGVISLVAIVWIVSFLSYDTNKNYGTIDMNASRKKPHRQTVLSSDSTILLRNGVHMPLFGFGTAGLRNPSISISYALQHGYKLLDTASDTGPWYRNEKQIATIFRDYEIRREDIFLTTKLHAQDHGTEEALASFNKSLSNLHTNYIDLYLIHHPECFGDMCKTQKDKNAWKESWKVMEKLYEKGVVRAIGVSNFDVDRLNTLSKFAKELPHVVQVWFDPFRQDWRLVDYCRDNGIVFQSYSPLGSQWVMQGMQNPVFKSETLRSIAEAHNKSPAQIVLRWLLQEGIAVIPKSNSEQHIADNINIFDFELNLNEMKQIRSLNGKAKEQ